MSHQTHEQYVQGVKQLAIGKVAHLPEVADRIRKAKLVYGIGQRGLRGVTHFDQWKHEDCDCDLAEICAFGEHSDTQLAGTTLHELAHIVAGKGAGHGKAWKEACKLLGLRKCKAAGQQHMNACFDQDIRFALASMPTPQDGRPATAVGNAQFVARPCSLGVGTRGGVSRGAGSGSRMRKYVCDCGVIVRAARDNLNATCNDCGSAFKQA
jgi:hypothetical protein